MAVALGWTATSQATVTTVAWYKLGEVDPGAAANTLGQNPTLDSSGNGFNLTRVGSPTNRADTAWLSMGSTLSMQFNGSTDDYGTNVSVTAANNNVGIELWAKPLALPSAGGLAVAVANGKTGFGGYGIVLNSAGEWQVFRVAQAFDFNVPATLGEWAHLGLVYDGGVEKLYLNGVLVASVSATPNAPNNGFDIGWITGGVGQQVRFNGLIDQVRVFTFTPGQFSPSDFLISVPEPGTVALLGLGGAVLVWKRRRSR